MNGLRHRLPLDSRTTLSAATVLSVVLALAGGCGDNNAGTDSGQDVQDSDATLDIRTPDVDVHDSFDDVFRDAADDLETSDATGDSDAPVEDATPDCPGNPMCPCTNANECFSGFCIETEADSLCSGFCSAEGDCPTGWKCARLQASGGDIAYICVYEWPTLCRPCRQDTDCKATGIDEGFRCVNQDQDGSYCALACVNGSECPEGYRCEQTGEGDAAKDVCLPEDGTCDCSSRDETAGYLTQCSRSNEYGTCTAERTCGDTCPAREPAAETCNRVDDDCDGETDEDVAPEECPLVNTVGTCTGHTVCINGRNECQGAYATTEACNKADDDCNGMTDDGLGETTCGIGECRHTVYNCEDGNLIACNDLEGVSAEVCDGLDNDCDGTADNGFVDTDLDTRRDCVDPDDDDDGVSDESDNCGLKKNPLQENLDEDEFGDVCDDDRDGDDVDNGVDNCPDTFNPGQEDENHNNIGDWCESDLDNDGILNENDNCPWVSNRQQENMDFDESGNVCDCDRDGDSVGNVGVDRDNDTCPAPVPADNCPDLPNMDQQDKNSTGVGDACETDWDFDGILNENDNCPWAANTQQVNMDTDRAGDSCDCDIDDDGFGNTGRDFDGNPCPAPVPADNCPQVYNPSQQDNNHNGTGDACEQDWDGDGILNPTDNCPWIVNAGQENQDGDDSGDKCDCDIDGDEVYNTGFDRNNIVCQTPMPLDNCRTVANQMQENMDGDSWGDACDCDIDGDGDLNANPGCANQDSDCAARNASVFHGATEKCNDIDDNCVNGTDEGCDDDDDQYCDSAMLTVGQPALCPQGGGDCNDNSWQIRPSATETCNLVDDNCNGATDENLGSTQCGLGECQHTTANCIGGNVQICDPMQGSTAEICDGKDNNCNGVVDEACDDDGDDYCDQNMTTVGQPSICPLGGGDCNDGNAQIRPSASEKCDNIDNNCDGDTDEGCDDDDDGYCDQNMVYSGNPTVCPNGPGDCNDMISSRNPGVIETCNGLDDNCNGATDEGLGTIRCGSGICDHTVQACIGGEPQTCNPMQGSTTEVCDGLDNSCNGSTDEGCDDDNDDYCDGAMGTTGSPAVCPNGGGDCNDTDGSIRPAAAEKCNNIDDDCDLSTDEGCDVDDDNYCNSAMVTVGTPTVCPYGGGDCNDGNAAIKPSASETCNNVDDDCSGTIDDNISSARDTFEPNESCSQYNSLGTIPENANAQQFAGKIYPALDKDYFRILFEESAHACVPFTGQTFRLTIDLTPPSGADCVDYTVILYGDSDTCAELTRTTATGCTAKQLTYDWSGTCTYNDDKYFRIAVVPNSQSDWECAGYTMTVDMLYL